MGSAIKRALGAEPESSTRTSSSGPSRAELDVLEQRVGRLVLLCEALWTILKEKHGMTDEELMARIEEIDARDGVRDGQPARKEARLCPRCNRVLTKSSPICLYCGQEVPLDVFGR